jgi:hypothetical protein
MIPQMSSPKACVTSPIASSDQLRYQEFKRSEELRQVITFFFSGFPVIASKYVMAVFLQSGHTVA